MYFSDHESHIDWPGIEHGPLLCEGIPYTIPRVHNLLPNKENL
jgi:hypothetical protein